MMFYHFKPARPSKPIRTDAHTDRLAEKIFDRLVKLQRRCADYLSIKARKTPLRSLKGALISMAVAAGSYCLFLIAGGLWSKPPAALLPTVKSIIPQTQQSAASGKRKQQALAAYLDSLEKAFIQDSINYSNNHLNQSK